MMNSTDINRLLRRPNPRTRIPARGERYLTTNWDGTFEPVKVILVGLEETTIEYDDGVRHAVSHLYFFEGMDALLVQ
jgi:hypothetical protein